MPRPDDHAGCPAQARGLARAGRSRAGWPSARASPDGAQFGRSAGALLMLRCDKLDFHGFNPDTPFVNCETSPGRRRLARRCGAAQKPASDWTSLERYHDRIRGIDRTRADRNCRNDRRRNRTSAVRGSRPVRAGAARHRGDGLPASDADPGAGDPRRADGSRRAGRGADRHRQDRRLHPADAGHPVRLARPGAHAAQPDPGADARAGAAGGGELRPVRQVPEADARADHRRREHVRPEATC